MSNSNSYDMAEDKAIVALGKVLEAVRRYGAYPSVVFDDPVTQAVIIRAYNGWPGLCSECDAKSFRQEFVRTWAAYSRQGLHGVGHLAGTVEITNRISGFYDHIPPPKLIGDPEKARAVLEGHFHEQQARTETGNVRGHPRRGLRLPCSYAAFAANLYRRR